MQEADREFEEATRRVLDVLEVQGLESRFVWFGELHRITGIDRGLLRNIISKLRKSREIRDMHGANNRIFFCLKRHYVKCRDAESRLGGRSMPGDRGGARAIQGATRSARRTRNRLERQKNRRRAKAFTKAKSQRPHKS